MKAFLLAAGRGTRLRPLTDRIPKCLTPVCGKPLLEWWIDLLERHGIREVLINLHYLPDQVVQFLGGLESGIRWTLFHEQELLGSAGTIRVNREYVRNEREFLILYADNLTDVDLSAFLDFHRLHGGCFSMGLFETQFSGECGIAELNRENIVVHFEEKPTCPRTCLANAGIYLAHPSMIDLMPAGKSVADIGYDWLPRMVGKMHGWKVDGFIADIGSLDKLAVAEQAWRERCSRKVR